jgi:hypothetical protein
MHSLQLPPGSLGLPVLGETLSFLFDPQFIEKRYGQYGPIFKSRILGRPTVFMVGPEAVELEELIQRHGLNWSKSQVEQLMGIVDGHPYLLR